jgi:hypothetical protein
MSEVGCLPWMWGHCSRERTDEEALAPFLQSFVSQTMPSGSNNREAVEQLAQSCGMPTASLSEELMRPSFLRGRTFFGYVGDEFDKIAGEYQNMQWWIDGQGLNFGPTLDLWDLIRPHYESLKELDPRPRGFEFERFLDRMFGYFKLSPRGSFRLTGEQIDGGFQLAGMTFLVEAKWQQEKIGVTELRAFAGDVQSKSQWTRGLFVSYAGFTNEGLTAFQRGLPTPIICLDGGELEQIIAHKLDFSEVLSLKMRAAGEENRAHVRLDELMTKYSNFGRSSLFYFP